MFRQLLLSGVLMLGLPAIAIPPERTLAQLEHRCWTAKDGVPPSIIPLDQTELQVDGKLAIDSRPAAGPTVVFLVSARLALG